jgi:hypothetical protein
MELTSIHWFQEERDQAQSLDMEVVLELGHSWARESDSLEWPREEESSLSEDHTENIASPMHISVFLSTRKHHGNKELARLSILLLQLVYSISVSNTKPKQSSRLELLLNLVV